MAEIIVTSTADSGAGSLRQAIADAADGDVILFDSDVFPTGQTTAILLSSTLICNKTVLICGGEPDGNGGYTSGTTKIYYVYRDVDEVRTKVVISSPDDAQEGETVLFENVCRIALDGQDTTRPFYAGASANDYKVSGICFINSVSNGGAAYLTSTSNGLFIDCLFVDDTSTGNGGGVYITANAVVQFESCAYINCTGNYGGAIYVVADSKATLNDCSFDNNDAELGGAALYITNNSQLIINASVIISCESPAGAIVLASTAENSLSSCIFDSCAATSSGGAIYSASSGRNTFNNCEFVSCSATNNGGAVFSYTESKNTLNSCVFRSCSAANGAALYSTNTSQNTLNACTFDGCSATNGGGLYSANTSQNTLNDCTFDGCAATNGGGGLYSNSASQNTLNACTFDGCIAADYGGGAIRKNDTSSIIADNCTFKDNTSATGGAFYGGGTAGQVAFTNCDFTGNSATRTSGGAAMIGSSGAYSFSNCTFKDNTTNILGGAIQATDTAGVIVVSCEFVNNSVVFYSSSSATATATKFDALTVANTASLTVGDGITTATGATLGTATITINDGAALTLTGTATIGAATISSAGRGYLALAPGLDASAATINNVVLCSYGADASQFHEDLGVLYWTAGDPTTPVLLEYEVEVEGEAQWTTLIQQTTGESYTRYFGPGVNLRLFDGEKFLTTSTPSSRTYYYIGGAEGSFTAPADWSLTRGGYAIPEPPTVKNCVFVVGDVAATAEEETTEETSEETSEP